MKQPECARAYHMDRQPSASWKLRAISVPFGSVHTMSVSIPLSQLYHLPTMKCIHLVVFDRNPPDRSRSPVACGRDGLQIQRPGDVHPETSAKSTLIKRKSERSNNSGDANLSRYDGAHIDQLPGAETGASVEPIILPQLVNFDPFSIVGRGSGLQCHHQGQSAISRQHGRKWVFRG